VTALENVECPENVAMDITGHKKKVSLTAYMDMAVA